MEKNNEEYYNNVIKASLRIAFIALLFLLSYLILKPFLIMTVWGIIIAIGIYPIFRKLSEKLGNKDKMASTIITLSALALIIIPSFFMLSSTVDSVKDIKESYAAGTLVVPPPPANVAEWPVVGKSVYGAWNLASTNIDDALKTFEPQIKEYVPVILDSLAGLGGTILLSIVSIIIAGILLLQAEAAEKTSKKIFDYLLGKYAEGFTDLANLTIRSVVQGILGIAIIQSLAAGILMLAYSIPGAGLWALIVLFLAIVQLPPTIIMLPVAIYVFSIMSTTSAVIFFILAMFISVADALLKPIFLGRGVDVPMLVILLGAIGGMIFMGILGLFLGAVILALTYKVFTSLINPEESAKEIEQAE